MVPRNNQHSAVLCDMAEKAESGKSMRYESIFHGCQGKVIHIHTQKKHILDVYIYRHCVFSLFRSSHLIMQNSLKARFFSQIRFVSLWFS